MPSMFLWVEVGFNFIPHFVPGIKANLVSMTFYLFVLQTFLQTTSKLSLASKVRNKWAHMEGRTGQDVPRSQAVSKPLADTPASWCPEDDTTFWFLWFLSSLVIFLWLKPRPWSLEPTTSPPWSAGGARKVWNQNPQELSIGCWASEWNSRFFLQGSPGPCA